MRISDWSSDVCSSELLDAYRRESGYIRAGIDLLIASRNAGASAANESDPDRSAALSRQAAPWRAWLHTNEAFAHYGGSRYTDWRLFQLAFILAHVPTLASSRDRKSTRLNSRH